MKDTLEMKGRMYYSAVALAKHFGMGYKTVLRWRDAGRLPGVIWIAGKQFWPLDQIEDHLVQGEDRLAKNE